MCRYVNDYIESMLDRDSNCKVFLQNSIPHLSLHLLTYLVTTNHLVVDDNLLALVGKSGNMSKMKFLLESGAKKSSKAVRGVCESGVLETIKWFVGSNGGMGTIRWVFGSSLSQDDLKYVAKSGNLDAIKWAQQLTLDLNGDVFEAALTSKNVETIKWLLANKCPLSQNTVTIAFETGVMEIALLLWNRCTKTRWHQSNLFSSIIKSCNFELMEWAEKQGIPFDINCFKMALDNGTLDQLKWLFAHGMVVENFTALDKKFSLKPGPQTYAKCPIPATVYLLKPALDKVKWLIEVGLKISPKSYPNVRDVETLNVLHSYGCEINPKYLGSIILTAPLVVIKWFRRHGYQIDKFTYLRALKRNNQNIIKWLDSEGCPKPQTDNISHMPYM